MPHDTELLLVAIVSFFSGTAFGLSIEWFIRGLSRRLTLR